ncbi:hypothetical protein CYMTET_49435 [Cymbomonas tetramitiformis]|uniref:DUF7869 domain-containing protein n=1 Tax=Cymbomonas tetramitiformis TaxID=36881 RepID=A0AAE0BS53_9CHLO|nr:hypothetical protein CYMTET_49435 [Cymbomonas tetramitiformis]
MFSRFSVALRKVNAWDIETLMEVARDSFKEMKPECALIDEVHDIKGWLSNIDPKNNPDGCYHQVNDVSYQHCFKVELDYAENVIVQGKRYSFDPEWLPKNGIQILAKVPEGVPDYVQPKSIRNQSERQQQKQMEKKKKPSDPLQEIEELVKDCKRNLGLDVRRVGETLKEQELKAHAERANIFLENYAKMQRDIEEGNFVLKKTTPWQMPDGYSATISGNSGLDTHRHVVNDTGEQDGEYDVQFEKMTKRSMAILLAPESEKHISERERQYGFRVNLGRAAGWSDYLYLCEVQDQIVNDEGVKCLKWKTCTPKVGKGGATNGATKDVNRDRRMNRDKAAAPGNFNLLRTNVSEQIAPFERDEILISWDWEESEIATIDGSTRRWIPLAQYDLVVKRLLAVEMAASYEPVTKRAGRLLLRDATELNDDEPDDEVEGGKDARDIETPVTDDDEMELDVQ